MSHMCTLHEIAMNSATRQPGMVDSITEDSPILGYFKWIPASHKLWNVAERLTDIKGAGFVNLDAPLPLMSSSSDLVTTSVHVMGGTMEVPSERAKKFGGPEKYFADRQDRILRDAGMQTEVQIVKEVMLRGAQAKNNLRDAGGQAGGHYILACRFDDLCNVGIYDPDQFDSGCLISMEVPYAGAEHYLRGADYEGVLGYSIIYRGHFGWQLLEPKRTVAAIVNIDEEHYPTVNMLDDMLADIRAQSGSTFLFCSPKAKIYGIHPHKRDYLNLINADNEMKTYIDTWNGIPIVTSHNLKATQRFTAGFIK